MLDLTAAARHSVYTLYNPYRIVIDFERPRDRPHRARRAPAPAAGARPASTRRHRRAPAAAVVPATPGRAPAPRTPPTVARSMPPVTPHGHHAAVASLAAARVRIVDAPRPPPPVAAGTPRRPAVAAGPYNARGGFSLSRQLGLGIARIVIDAGHGGHDPGAKVQGPRRRPT